MGDNRHKVNAKELFRKAARNPAMLPIPDYVLNSQIRDEFVPSKKALVYEYKNGDTEPIVICNEAELPEHFYTKRDEFRSWLAESGLEVPLPYQTDNDELRFLISHKHDF